jgi:hypothetical protein
MINVVGERPLYVIHFRPPLIINPVQSCWFRGQCSLEYREMEEGEIEESATGRWATAPAQELRTVVTE